MTGNDTASLPDPARIRLSPSDSILLTDSVVGLGRSADTLIFLSNAQAMISARAFVLAAPRPSWIRSKPKRKALTKRRSKGEIEPFIMRAPRPSVDPFSRRKIPLIVAAFIRAVATPGSLAR